MSASPNRRLKTVAVCAAVVLLLAGLSYAAYRAGLFGINAVPDYDDPSRTAEEVTKDLFGIDTVHSSVDYNHNGVDDYADIVAGAKIDAQNHPRYDGAYQPDGYPPDDVGVCTDVVWRAFKNAGYCLRDMVDNDIKARKEAYPGITVRDDKIDFRRVVNLRVFFDTYAQSVTTDWRATADWQPGDIVIFGDNKHIGIVSDRRNSRGQPYIIHNGGQQDREEDYLSTTSYSIAAHYRFDASKIDPSVLIAWHD